MSREDVEAMRAAVRRDAARTYTDDELFEAKCLYGTCQVCGAARTSKMTEPESGSFLLSMVCTADERHAC